MVNDEVNNKAINIEIKVAQYSAKAILKAMKKIIEDAAEKSQPLVNVNEKVYRLTLNFFTTLAVNLFTSSEVLTFN